LQAGKFLPGSCQGEAGAAGAAGQAGKGKLGIQTGYADWAIFSPIWLLLECYWDLFFKFEVAQRNGNILGCLLLQQIFFIFT
jgi:hypothetical protein